MKREIKKYQVVILGDTYTIMSDETEEHVMHAANYTHALMQDITQNNAHVTPKKAAVLIALRLASKAIRAEEEIKKNDDTRADIAHYLDRELLNLLSD